MVSPYLSFPPQCGCTDPGLSGIQPAAPCDDGSCETLIVFGCTDVNACNYDPLANFNIPELCCYGIDDCNNLDWTLICPTLNMDETRTSDMDLSIYPNPTRDNVWMEIASAESKETEVMIYNLQGKMVHRERYYYLSRGTAYSASRRRLCSGYLLSANGRRWPLRKVAIFVKN